MKVSQWLGLGLIALALLARYGLPQPDEKITPPAAELRAIVEPIGQAVTDRADRAKLGSFYAALADLVERDAGKYLKTTSTLQAAHSRGLQLLVQQTPLHVSSGGKYAGLGKQIDEALARYAGIPVEGGKYKVIEFSPEHQRRTVEYFRGLAWAFSR